MNVEYITDWLLASMGVSPETSMFPYPVFIFTEAKSLLGSASGYLSSVQLKRLMLGSSEGGTGDHCLHPLLDLIYLPTILRPVPWSKGPLPLWPLTFHPVSGLGKVSGPTRKRRVAVKSNCSFVIVQMKCSFKNTWKTIPVFWWVTSKAQLIFRASRRGVHILSNILIWKINTWIY